MPTFCIPNMQRWPGMWTWSGDPSGGPLGCPRGLISHGIQRAVVARLSRLNSQCKSCCLRAISGQDSEQPGLSLLPDLPHCGHAATSGSLAGWALQDKDAAQAPGIAPPGPHGPGKLIMQTLRVTFAPSRSMGGVGGGGETSLAAAWPTSLLRPSSTP